jgi:hypothetical protein
MEMEALGTASANGGQAHRVRQAEDSKADEREYFETCGAVNRYFATRVSFWRTIFSFMTR